jgi:hypothetical protein
LVLTSPSKLIVQEAVEGRFLTKSPVQSLLISVEPTEIDKDFDEVQTANFQDGVEVAEMSM